MRVKKVAFLNNQSEFVGEISKDVMGVIVNSIHPEENLEILLKFTLDKSKYSKLLDIRVDVGAKFIEDQKIEPKNFRLERFFQKNESGYYVGCYMFRDFLFEVIAEDDSEANEAKAILLMKKYVFSEDAKWSKLNEEVQLMEKVLTQSLCSNGAISQTWQYGTTL